MLLKLYTLFSCSALHSKQHNCLNSMLFMHCAVKTILHVIHTDCRHWKAQVFVCVLFVLVWRVFDRVAFCTLVSWRNIICPHSLKQCYSFGPQQPFFPRSSSGVYVWLLILHLEMSAKTSNANICLDLIGVMPCRVTVKCCVSTLWFCLCLFFWYFFTVTHRCF